MQFCSLNRWCSILILTPHNETSYGKPSFAALGSFNPLPPKRPAPRRIILALLGASLYREVFARNCTHFLTWNCRRVHCWLPLSLCFLYSTQAGLWMLYDLPLVALWYGGRYFPYPLFCSCRTRGHLSHRMPEWQRKTRVCSRVNPHPKWLL